MTFWPLFWTVILAVTVAGFLVMAVVVAIGGFGDVKTMLQRLREDPPDA